MTRNRWSGALGSAVVLAFLLGLLSGPLRPCDSHAGHAHALPVAGSLALGSSSASHEHHTGAEAHASPDADGGDDAATGCDCLGLCSTETGPFLPIATMVAESVAPGPVESSAHAAGSLPTVGSFAAVPLARGPPLPV